MKFTVIILLLLGSLAHGQRRRGISALEQFNKEDSIEGFYTNDALLNVIRDTLPVYTYDESSAWRYMKLVSYFYDSSKALKKITFRNGRDGYYYFYIKGGYLRKARSPKGPPPYYFSVDDNKRTASDIDQRVSQEPEKKDFYETLKMGKAFLEKFKTLL